MLNLFRKNKYKIERAKNPQKNKQQKTVSFIQTKQKSTRENQEGMIMQCKEVKAELYEDMGRLKIKKIYD